MTLLYTNRVFLDHVTGTHPEHPRRLAAVTDRLEKQKLIDRCHQPLWMPATVAEVGRIQSEEYVKQIEDYAAVGGGRIEVDTVVCNQSYNVAMQAAGAACDAVRRVTANESKTALCLTRPPGHHARPQNAMGFCLFNNVAIAAHAALAEHGLDRVLIVDWDVHHGNGTQEMFWDDGRVGFLSIHRWPFYPGTGAADETGSGRGLGCMANIPVTFGTSRNEYHERFERALTDLAKKMRPQLVLISAGFDAHREDPIGSLELEIEDFVRLSRTVLATAREYAHGRVVSILEGGYNPARLAESIDAHLTELLASET